MSDEWVTIGLPEPKRCEVEEHVGPIQIERVYRHTSSGQIGDIVGYCRHCNAKVWLRDNYLPHLQFDDTVTVFDCEVSEGPPPTTVSGVITTTFKL